MDASKPPIAHAAPAVSAPGPAGETEAVAEATADVSGGDPGIAGPVAAPLDATEATQQYWSEGQQEYLWLTDSQREFLSRAGQMVAVEPTEYEYNGESIGLGEYTAGVAGAFANGVAESFLSGEAADSAVGVINELLNWGAENVTFGLSPRIEVGSVYGHDDRYRAGQSVGEFTTSAMSTVSLVNGLRKAAGNQISSNLGVRAPKTGAAAIHRGSGLAASKHKLAVDVAAGRKSRLELLRDLSGDEITQAAHFFRQQANRVGGKFKNAAREFNLARARYLEQGGPQPPVSLTEFMKLHGLTN